MTSGMVCHLTQLPHCKAEIIVLVYSLLLIILRLIDENSTQKLGIFVGFVTCGLSSCLFLEAELKSCV